MPLPHRHPNCTTPARCACTHGARGRVRIAPSIHEAVWRMTDGRPATRALVESHFGRPGVGNRLPQEGMRSQLKVNVGQIWAQYAGTAYASSDRVVVATREALQNGTDAIKRMALFTSWAGAGSFVEARKLLGRAVSKPGGDTIAESFPTIGGEREVRFYDWVKANNKALPDRLHAGRPAPGERTKR